MRLDLLHRTRYAFTRPLTDVVQLLRLTPTSCLTQTVLDWRIDVDCDARLRESRDGYGNLIHMLYVNQPVTSLAITASGRVITENRSGVVQGLPGDLPPEVFLRSTELTAPGDALNGLAADVAADREHVLASLHDLNAAIHRRMTFDAGATEATTPAADAYAKGRGVCQDFAHIFIAVARAAGVPARYVSGHLFRRDGAVDQPAGHAWAEAWVPDLGWVAFDPTHGLCADEAYVRIAGGLDYRDSAPLAGARRGGGTEDMTVEVQVSRGASRSQRQSQRQSGGGAQSQSQSQSRD